MSSGERTQPRCIRPSPNEEAAYIEKRFIEKRRKRLLEVRQQEKNFARQVRQNVHRKKQIETEILEQHLKECAEKSHKMELKRLEDEVMKYYLSVGQGQKDAAEIGQEEKRLLELRLFMKSQQMSMAKKRQLVAMKQLSSVSPKSQSDRVANIRSQALTQERENVKKVMSSSKANRQSPTLIMELEPHLKGYLTTRRVKGVECFASTYFHLPDNLVNRETQDDIAELDANQIAIQVNLEEENRQQHLSAVHEEQKEKARLRHKHALAKLKLEKDKDFILKDLSLLVREDRTRRQRVLQQIPNNVFQPEQDRLQKQEEEQCQLEYAFEKLLSGGLDQENIKSPLVPTIGDNNINSSPIQSSSVTISESNDQSVPDPTHPVPLSPPSLPASLITVTPLPTKHAVHIDRNPSVIIPCGAAVGSSDLTIQTLSPSFESQTTSVPDSSDHTQSSYDPCQTGNTGYSSNSTSDVMTASSTTGTSESTDVSRLIGLIRLQQQQKQKQVLQQRQQQDKQGSPELRMDTDPSPLSLSISTLTNSSDQCESDPSDTNKHTNSHVISSTLSSAARNAVVDSKNLKSSIIQPGTTEQSNTGMRMGPGGMNIGMSMGPDGMNSGMSMGPGGMNSGMSMGPDGMNSGMRMGPGGMNIGMSMGPYGMNSGMSMGPDGMNSGMSMGLYGMNSGMRMGPGGLDPSIQLPQSGHVYNSSMSQPSFVFPPHYYYSPNLNTGWGVPQYPWLQYPPTNIPIPTTIQSQSNVMMTQYNTVSDGPSTTTPDQQTISDSPFKTISIVTTTSDSNNNGGDICSDNVSIEHSSDSVPSGTLGNKIEATSFSIESSNDTPLKNLTNLQYKPKAISEIECGLQRKEFIQNLLSSLNGGVTSPLSIITSSPSNDTPHVHWSESPDKNGSESPNWNGSESPRNGSESPNRNEYESPNRNGSESPNRNEYESPNRNGSESPNRNEYESPNRNGSESLLRNETPHGSESPNRSQTNNTEQSLLSPSIIDPIDHSISSDNSSYRELDRRATPTNHPVTNRIATPTNHPVTNRITTPTNHPVTNPDIDNCLPKSLSLQEAFIQRNREFAKRSQERVSNIEKLAKVRQSRSSFIQQGQSGSFSQQRHVSFSSPLIKTLKQTNTNQDKVERHHSSVGAPERLLSKHKEKITSREMHERNLRLYSKLPEVKRKQSELKQKEELVRNREKAKKFHQNLRLKMKGKKVSKS